MAEARHVCYARVGYVDVGCSRCSRLGGWVDEVLLMSGRLGWNYRGPMYVVEVLTAPVGTYLGAN